MSTLKEKIAPISSSVKNNSSRLTSNNLASDQIFYSTTQANFFKAYKKQSQFISRVSEIMQCIEKRKVNKVLQEVKLSNRAFRKYLNQKRITHLKIEDIVWFEEIYEKIQRFQAVEASQTRLIAYGLQANNDNNSNSQCYSENKMINQNINQNAVRGCKVNQDSKIRQEKGFKITNKKHKSRQISALAAFQTQKQNINSKKTNLNSKTSKLQHLPKLQLAKHKSSPGKIFVNNTHHHKSSGGNNNSVLMNQTKISLSSNQNVDVFSNTISINNRQQFFSSLIPSNGNIFSSSNSSNKISISKLFAHKQMIKKGFMTFLEKIQNLKKDQFINEAKYLEGALQRECKKIKQYGYEPNLLQKKQKFRSNIIDQIEMQQKQNGLYSMVMKNSRQETLAIEDLQRKFNQYTN